MRVGVRQPTDGGAAAPPPPPEPREQHVDREADRLFPASLRRGAVLYVIGVAISIAIAGFFVHGQDAFLVAWVIAGAPGTLPALWFTAQAARRSVSPYQPFWRWWFASLIGTDLCGTFILLAVVTGSPACRAIAALLALGVLATCATGLGNLVRSRSGYRTFAVDLVDAALCIVVVTAPVALLFIEPAVSSGVAWFAVPCLIVACVMPASVLAASTLYARMPPGEREAEGIFIALGAVSTLNAWLLVAQSLSEFSLPSSPLLVVQATGMGLLLLHVVFSFRTAPAGLDRLPVHAQVRRRSVVPVLVIVGVIVLVVEALLLRSRVDWTIPFTVAVLGGLVVLAMVRHALTLRETKRLYVALEEVADERKRMLSNLMRAVEGDRHRVAAQLHEQAVGSLAVLGTMMQASTVALAPDAAAAVNEALTEIRGDLVHRAESLRQLMLAVRAPELDDESISAALLVYCRELFGDTASPAIEIAVDPELVLDWTTKTIVYRIVQEAVHNVWRHAQATRIDIDIRAGGTTVVADITDDGHGFDPAHVVFESGIATMRLFARLGAGSVEVTSRPSPPTGTTVHAVLGSEPITVDLDDDRPGPRLHVISGDRADEPPSDHADGA